MLDVNQSNVETFFDCLDEMALTIFEYTKRNYLDCVLLSCDYIVSEPSIEEELDEEVIEKLDEYYQKIHDVSFKKEDIRKAFQLALLKAFKHMDIHLSNITPDSIGLLFAYFIDGFFKGKDSLDLFDATVGTGNLLITTLNHCHLSFNKIYGVDHDQNYMNIALRLANITEYEIEFFIQNNLQKMLVSPVDVVISDLPIDDESDALKTDLVLASKGVLYKPYLMIESLMKYCKMGGYMMYLIPNNFFTKDKNNLIKEIILKESYIQALIELPLNLFKEQSKQKSILILRKKAPHVLPNKDILMIQFPSFTDKEKVSQTIDKINVWFNNIQK